MERILLQKIKVELAEKKFMEENTWYVWSVLTHFTPYFQTKSHVFHRQEEGCFLDQGRVVT